jgi:ABC-2 type transport system ATP-binding protein
MIEVSHLTKRYGDKCAVNDISFSVNDGEILGFLGPNGAGKSTTMNMLTGYLSSNEGSIKIAGIDILEDPNGAKKHIGYLPEQPPLYMDMTVKEYLNFIFNLKGCKLKRDAHLAEICDLVKITSVYGRVIKNLSKGYKQRVGLAQALVGNPDVLVLDEPTVGLDPKQIIEIRSLIKHLGRKHTIILSSHILPEVQSVCERIIIINRGVLVADDTEINLSNSLAKQHRIVVRIAGPEEAALHAISGLTGVKQVMELGTKEPGSFDFQIETEEGKDVRRGLFTVLCDRKWPILALDSGEMNLEDIFLKLTSEDTVDLHKKKPRVKSGGKKYESILNDGGQQASKDVSAEKSPKETEKKEGEE